MTLSHLKTLTLSSWQNAPTEPNLINHLENGQVLFFPHLAFHFLPTEQAAFTPDNTDPASKNISFNPKTAELRGVAKTCNDETQKMLQGLLARYASYATQLIQNVLPHYTPALTIGRTSFRPIEVRGRVSSYRKDDTRLHVDAFPANPNQGKRILRVFSNVNPEGQARIWRLGEPFEEVAKTFLPRLRRPLKGMATLLAALKITKSRRSLYDHYMLELHHRMKADTAYQQNAKQVEIHFPAGSSWIVQTDHVSHAAMSGQYLLEQTFYLPVTAMEDATQSPLRILEKLLGKSLA